MEYNRKLITRTCSVKLKTLLFSIMFTSFAISANSINKGKNNAASDGIQHGIVFYEEGKYGGWPANHGIWIWGNEILVGFIQANYQETDGLHDYDPASTKNKYARSKDGGLTWSIEDALEHGQAAWRSDDSGLSESIADFTHPDFIITFHRHKNDYGPTRFYYSENRGLVWHGPYMFPNLGTNGVAARTDYIIECPKEMNAFLTVAKSNEREGRVALSRTTDGGVNWEFVSWIGTEHAGFDIMSSSVRLSPTKLLTVIRTRTRTAGNEQDLLTAYLSSNNGQSWVKLKNPVADTGSGGSPPALVRLKDGRLALAYIYRSEGGSRVNVKFSSDEGANWSDEIVLRSGDGANRDVGYPRMIQREDGKLVLIYYWNNVNKEGAEPYRYIASTIFDPDQWK